MQFQIGVKALIEKGGKILLIKRSEKYNGMEGYWDIPGGRIDEGEEPESGLRREIKEETGLDMIKIKRIIDASIVYKDETKQIVRITYHVEAAGDRLYISNEHTDFIWIDPKDICFEIKDKLLKKALDKLTL